MSLLLRRLVSPTDSGTTSLTLLGAGAEGGSAALLLVAAGGPGGGTTIVLAQAGAAGGAAAIHVDGSGAVSGAVALNLTPAGDPATTDAGATAAELTASGQASIGDAGATTIRLDMEPPPIVMEGETTITLLPTTERAFAAEPEVFTAGGLADRRRKRGQRPADLEEYLRTNLYDFGTARITLEPAGDYDVEEDPEALEEEHDLILLLAAV